MDAEEIRAAKRIMEKRIYNEVDAAIKEFKEKTGLTPAYINIDMISLQQIGEKNPSYLLSKVNSEVHL